MSTQLSTGVLVGVDGSAGSDKAVRFGALAARRSGAPLTLVHVVPDYMPLAPMPHIPDDLAGAALSLTATARRVAEPNLDGTPVVTLVRPGSTTAVLLELAARAELVVLGHNTRTHLGRLFTGAVTAGVASRSTRPLVTVPDIWDPNRTADEIVVGVKSSSDAEGLLERAFATAEVRGAHLTLIHAWELPGGVYDDIIVRRTHDAEWNLRTLENLSARLDELQGKYPAVAADACIVHAQSAHALVEKAAGSDLLMLERRAGRFPARLHHLGSTTRAVLRDARCPVEVFPPHEVVMDMERLDLEVAGASLT